MNVISLKDVSLKYRVEFKENGRILPEDFWVLKDINIDIGKGEAICVIGENGAGKTTLLKIISGMLKPDRGSINVNGEVSAVMEIGGGFQKDLTGRENIYIISSLFGLPRGEIENRYNDIIKFASIGRFINAPVKIYSQGMYMRLAFAIAVHIASDILLVDDIFVVGDFYAQHKCIHRMFELRDMGKTIVLVTHDIEMAKHFCQRGILLKDGRMIKDGMLKEVISYYLTTVGDKRGVGILRGTHLGLVFNNGKLILNWDDDTITKEWAGYASMLSCGNWYSSLQADWEFKESSKDRIVLEGKCWDLPIAQLWDIKLDDIRNEIDLKIEMDILESCDFRECKLCFMFKEDYKYWFNPYKKELFKKADLSKEFSWECINSEVPAVSFIGLSGLDGNETSLPSVILEDEAYVQDKILEVKNTDRMFKARVLQSKIIRNDINKLGIRSGKQLFFHAKVKVIKDLSAEDRFRQIMPKTMLPKEIGKRDLLSLSVDDNHKVSLFCQNKEITSSKGFKTNFYYNGKVYHSSDANWRIHKVSDSRLDIINEWEDSYIRQIWNIELLGDGLVSWKVYMDTVERAIIRNSEFILMFSSGYNEWVTSVQEGIITEEGNTEDFKNIIMRNDSYGIIGLKGFFSNGLEFPSVLLQNINSSEYQKFNSVKKKIDKNISILSSNDQELITSLYLLDKNSKESIDSPKGLYLICDARILVGSDLQQKQYIENIKKEKKQMVSSSLKKTPFYTNEGKILENGNYKFSFTEGKGNLFFKGKEITKGFGIYTSLYSREINSRGEWYASLDAIWEIVSFKKNRLLIRGTWPYLPVTQTWEIKTVDNGFVWKIDMEVFISTSIERQQNYIMLSRGYSNWMIPGIKSGSFPEDFTLLHWDRIYKEKCVDRLYIGTSEGYGSNILPSLSFFCLEPANFEAVVENSNVTFNGRIVGFERMIDEDNKVLKPGTYRYFNGKIDLRPKHLCVPHIKTY